MNELVLRDLSNEELLAHLGALCANDCALKAKIVAYLVEVEERRLHLSLACSSMYDFCVRHMKMSGSMTSRWLAAARIVGRHRCLLPALARGEIHIETLLLLRDHLNEANAEELLAAARGKSASDVREMLVARAPKPDVPDTVAPCVEQCVLPTASAQAPADRGEHASRVTPLSPTRYEVKFTASQAVREKLERARDLMRHRNPEGELAVVFERALDTLLEKLERERLGKAERPRRQGRGARHGVIPRGARREVFVRDGERCTFEDGNGNRCPARGFLELDHIAARARGGSGEASNVRVLCRPHNRFHAENTFGRAHVEHAIDVRRRTSCARSTASKTDATANVVRSSDGGPAAGAAHDVPAVSLECVATFGVERGASLTPLHPPGPPTHVTERARALEGIIRLGFKRTDATRALDAVLARRGFVCSPDVLPDVVRETIGLLT